jgi:hypothetical protein
VRVLLVKRPVRVNRRPGQRQSARESLARVLLHEMTSKISPSPQSSAGPEVWCPWLASRATATCGTRANAQRGSAGFAGRCRRRYSLPWAGSRPCTACSSRPDARQASRRRPPPVGACTSATKLRFDVNSS